MKRKSLMLCIAIAMTALLFGCGKKEEAPVAEPEKKEVVEKEEEPEEVEEEIPERMARSYLTGEWIDEELASKRPYAVMIGNTVDALPQYGLGSADIVYEVPVEGSYTRLMAIFQDITGLEKIGSTRSCRHYFVYFASEFNAIYVHYGQAVYAEGILSQSYIHNINGMDSRVESVAFYRDHNRKAPHNAFTSEEGLLAATEKLEYPTEVDETYQGHYQFAEDDAPVELDGEDALVVSPGYFVNKPWFIYNEEDGLYYRYEYKDEQIDADGEEEQLKVKNILIQYCNWEYADENGYLNIDTLSDGTCTGIYITNGKMIPVTWKKDDSFSPAHYYDKDGNEITLNQGKTWVCVVRNNYAERFHVYETEEALKEARAAE